jgi:hypothetical protein
MEPDQAAARRSKRFFAAIFAAFAGYRFVHVAFGIAAAIVLLGAWSS